MGMEVDRLDIQIQAEATKAVGQLDKLISKLGNVSSALTATNTSGLRNFSSGIKQLSSSMQSMSNVKTTDFNRLTKGIEKLGLINNSAIYKAGNSIRSFANSLQGIGSVSDDAVKLGEVANGISKLGSAKIEKVTTILPKLSASLKEFMTTLSTAPNVSENIINMTNAMANLASNGSKFSSTVNGLGRAAKTLSKSNNEASNSFKLFGKSSGDASRSIYTLTHHINSLVGAYFSLKFVIGSVLGGIKKSMDFIETVNLFQTSYKKIGEEAAVKNGMTWGSESADAYAKAFIGRAQTFNDKLVNSLGLDPNTMMNYQATFGQISNSLGLTSKTVENVSQSFTMLGNDIASLWNVDTKNAMEKLQSGLVGQTRPLRELGIDTTQASLQLTAFKYGIHETVSKMSQAEKVQLRWLSIMDQSSVAFGDMAKTINSPANQLRILKQQWDNLTRSIGNLFMPVISAVLPYINAVVIALRNMIDTLATAMGFELPDYTDSKIYTDVTGGIDGISDATDKAAGSADKATKANERLRKSFLGIDEINVISKNESGSGSSGGSGSGSGGSSSGSGNSKLDDAINKKTDSYIDKWNEQLATMQNKAEELAAVIQPKIEAFVTFLEKISPLFAGIAAAFITYEIITWFGKLAEKIGLLSLSPAGVIAIAIGALAALVTAVGMYYDDLVKKDLGKHFGDVILSQKDIDEISNQLTNNKYTANIDIYLSAKAKLDDLKTDIQGDLKTLDNLNWKVSIGLGLTKEEQSTYKSTIEKFITDTESYINQQNYVVDLAIKAVAQDDGKFSTEMQSLVDEYFKGSKDKMASLGKKLRNTMDKALADGVIDATEEKTISNLISEMNEITSQVSDAQFKAKLQMITVDGDLTADSFKDLTKKIQSAIDGKVKSEKEAYNTALVGINVAYQAKMDETKNATEKAKLKKQWDSDVKKLGVDFSNTKANITLSGMNFSLDELTKNYKTELDKTAPGLAAITKTTLSPAISSQIEKMDATTAMGVLTQNMTQSYINALSHSGMSAASQTGLKKMLKALEPSKEQLQKIYDDSLKAGTRVPDGVSAALTDAANLGALTGDMDSIAFLIGQKLSTDPTFMNLLKTGKIAGKDLNQNLIDGLKSKIPDLQLQAGKLVTKSGTAINDKLTEKKETIKGYGSRYISYFKSSFDNDGTAVLSVKGWLDKISDMVKNFQIPDLNFKLKLDATGSSAADLVKSTGIKISKRAVGGFPDVGEMFIAREAGPELVGTLGGHTAVANNSQIEAGIEEAAYRGYARAMMDFGGNNQSGSNKITVESNLYVDSEKLWGISQKGKAKYERRNQTALNLT